MARTRTSSGTARIRTHVRNLAPGFLVAAAVLLAVDHWEHFDMGDLALLLLIVVSAVAQILGQGLGHQDAGLDQGSRRDLMRIKGVKQ